VFHAKILNKSVPYVLASLAVIGISLVTLLGPGVAYGGSTGSSQGAEASPPSAASSSSAVARRLVLDNGGTTARYVVTERTLGMNEGHEVAGSASSVSGQVALDGSGNPVGDLSRVTVDVRSFETDEPARDEVIRATILDTNDYPTSEFRLTRLQGFDTWPTAGDANFRACGELSIHGAQRPVCLDGVGHFTPNSVSGTLSGALSLRDFAIPVPQLGPLATIEDNIQLELDFRGRLS
jgi:polyisoprenoid-binding protein YceI